MPMVFNNEHDGCCTGLWEIAEDIPFFESFLSFRSTASNPEKIKQQLAARMILHSIDSNFPFADVEVLKGGKPVLKNNALKFSLSHCNGYAAAIVSSKAEVGIDIEPIHERVLKIEKKFLHPTELTQLDQFDYAQRVEYATLFWTLKEAMYKWWGRGSVDFSNDMVINAFDINQSGTAQMKFAQLPEDTFELKYFLHNQIWFTTLCK
jgi:4'-phosphopantetheinyl transferase